MAFLRIEKKKSGDYIRIVRSIRIEGKHTHETLYSLGKVQDYTPQQLSRIADKLKQASTDQLPELISMVDQQITELGRYNYGFYLVYNRIFMRYNLQHFFDRMGKRYKLSFNLSNAILLMLIERLHDPVSKLGNYVNQQDYLGLAPVKLQHLYRSLDYLADNQRYLQQHIFQINRNLFNQTIDVVFYDVTTFYFESEWEQEGALRRKGFSKDGKVGSTQVVFGLLIDKNKNPIGYQLYKGDTYEGHTFADQVEKLKKEYQIDRLILVADRGMLSQANREVITENGYEFIFGERLKNLPKKVNENMLDLSTYQLQWISSAQQPVKVRYKVFKQATRTIIVTYSERRAEKDRKERAEKIIRAQGLIKHPAELKNKARRFYIKQQGKDHFVLDTEKINNAAKYDGFLAITTNTANMEVEQVLDNYHHLFQIEHTFRTFKSYLETRPMFHWTNKRIEGHICLCYLAYVLLNNLLQRVNKYNITEIQIRKILSEMQVSHIQQLNEQYYLRSKQQDQENIILDALAIHPLTNLIPVHKIQAYLHS